MGILVFIIICRLPNIHLREWVWGDPRSFLAKKCDWWGSFFPDGIAVSAPYRADAGSVRLLCCAKQTDAVIVAQNKEPRRWCGRALLDCPSGQVNIDFYSPLREPKDIFLHMEALDLVVVGIEVDGSLIHELLGDRFLQTGEQALVLGGLKPFL